MVSMNEREQLIEKLVTTMHLSVPERLALSPNNVRYIEVPPSWHAYWRTMGISHLVRGRGKKER